jgi:hypothetical protein
MKTFLLCEQSEKNLETILVVNNTAKVLLKICQLMDNQLVSRLNAALPFWLKLDESTNVSGLAAVVLVSVRYFLYNKSEKDYCINVQCSNFFPFPQFK